MMDWKFQKIQNCVEEYMGKYPVISISLKGINAATYEDAFDFAGSNHEKVARNVQFLLGVTP